MEDIKVLAIDLAKNVFQLCGVNEQGEKLVVKRVKRPELLKVVLQIGARRVVMEACGGSHHWGREFIKQGMQVELIAPQNVKPFVRRQKTDARDAEAIAVAALQDHVPRVSVKSTEQQDLQFIHRARSQFVSQRTALVNEMRGILAEQGIVSAQGRARFQRWYSQDGQKLIRERLSSHFCELFSELWGFYVELCKRVESCEKQIEEFSLQSEACQRLLKIEGVGVLTSTAIVAAVGERAEGFRDSKHFSSWLGLTPRQHSSGGKEVVLGISKKGDRYIRELLIHGARNVVRWALVQQKKNGETKHPRKSWIIKKKTENKHVNSITVAYARKNARVIWKLLNSGETYLYA